LIADRWGVTDAEVVRRYPCDDLVPDPVFAAWRGVTVAAGPDRVWPWITQIRLAPYSYDWIDNGGRRSPQELRGLDDPVPGEPFTRAVGRHIGRVLSVEAERHYTGSIAGVVISYVLEPDSDRTRLLMKLVAGSGRLYAPLLSVGDLVMARRQLLNIKRLAEASATAATGH
jgi:hypothetical protein